MRGVVQHGEQDEMAAALAEMVAIAGSVGEGSPRRCAEERKREREDADYRPGQRRNLLARIGKACCEAAAGGWEC